MPTDWGQVFGDFLKRPENQSALVKSGFDVFGSILAGNAQNQKAQEDRQFDERTMARNRQFDLLGGQRGQENADFALRQGQQDDADATVLRAMGNSPLEFQRERMKMDAVANALEAGGPANLSAHLAPWARGMDMSKFRPSAEAEAPYWNAVAQASKGRFGGANLGGVYGSGASGLDDAIMGTARQSGESFDRDWNAHTDSINQNFDRSMGMATQDFNAAQKAAEEKKGGGGIMGLLGKALPVAAAFIPGVGPIASLGIGALAGGIGNKMQGGSFMGGAASGALNSAISSQMPRVFGAGAGSPKLDPVRLTAGAAADRMAATPFQAFQPNIYNRQSVNFGSR